MREPYAVTCVIFVQARLGQFAHEPLLPPGRCERLSGNRRPYSDRDGLAAFNLPRLKDLQAVYCIRRRRRAELDKAIGRLSLPDHVSFYNIATFF